MTRASATKQFGIGPRSFLLLSLLSILFVPPTMKGQATSLSTGIEGLISVGPSHGGPAHEGEADSAPLRNTAFEVTGAAGVVASFTTDDVGHFRVALPPGHYTIKARGAKKFPRCGPFEVEVPTDGFKKIQWECDSGMR